MYEAGKLVARARSFSRLQHKRLVRDLHQAQGVDFGFCQSDIICENLWNLWETSELGGDIETGTGFFHAGHVTVPNYFGVWICDAQLLDEGVHGAPLF